MKKKIYSLLSLVLMSICVIGANAEGEVAQIGDVKYATVAEAFAAVGDGETIELLSDASFDSEIAFDKDIACTLDGGGYTLTDNGTDQASGIGATGTYSGIKITAGHLTVTNITFKRKYKKQYAVLSLHNKAKLTVSDNVAFNAIQGGSGAAIRSANYAEVEISGKNVTMINCNAWGGVIYMLEKSKATIEDVEITATSPIARNGIGLANNPELTLKKGTISGYTKAGIGVGSDDNTDAAVGAECVVDIYDKVAICCTTGIATKSSAAAKINVSCNIEGATTGIDVAGGILNFDGTIRNCPTGINVKSGTVNITGGTVSGCSSNGVKATGGAINLSGGTISACGNGILFNNEGPTGAITGGIISSCNTGLNINTTGVTMSGNPEITANTTNVWLPAAGKITLEGEFTGNIRIKTGNDDASQITERLLVGEGFVSIADVTSVVNDYHTEQTVYLKDDGTFAWTKTPVFGIGTDGGVYTLAEEDEQKVGVIRFITTLVDGIESDAVEYLGTYALSGADFELEAPEGTGPTFGKFENVTLVKEKRNSYIVDAIKIPAEHFSTTVSGISFVKIKGIATPVFNSVTTSVDSFNKNLGVNAESDFEAVAEEVSE